MIEAENEIFDDYYEGPRGIAVKFTSQMMVMLLK